MYMGRARKRKVKIRPAGLPAPSPSGTANPDRTDSPPVPTAGARADHQGKPAPEGTRCRASGPHGPGSDSGHRLARHSPVSGRNPPSSPPALPAKAPRRSREAQPGRRCVKRPAWCKASGGTANYQVELVNVCRQASARSSTHASRAMTCRNDRRSPRRQRTLPRCCDNFLYGFKGTPPARQAVRPGPVRTRERESIEDSRELTREQSQWPAGRQALCRLWGGRPAAPCRAGALGARRRHQASRPAPAGRQFPQQRGRCTATARTDRAILLAPDILSPRKDHRLGRASGTSFGWRKRHPRQ
jgi:hypothetical protein